MDTRIKQNQYLFYSSYIKYFLDKWLFTVLSQHTLLEYKVSWNAFSSRGSGNMTEEATQKEGKEREETLCAYHSESTF